VAPAESCGHGRANNDFSMGEGEHVCRGRVTQMNLVEAAAFLGRNEDDAKFGRKPAVAVFRKAFQSVSYLTTEVREAQRIPALAIAPVDGDGFCCHDDPEDSEFGGGGYSAKQSRGSGGRIAIRSRSTRIDPSGLRRGDRQKAFPPVWWHPRGWVFPGSGRRTQPYRQERGGLFRGIGEWVRSSGKKMGRREEYLRPGAGGSFLPCVRLFRVEGRVDKSTKRGRFRGVLESPHEFFWGDDGGGPRRARL